MKYFTNGVIFFLAVSFSDGAQLRGVSTVNEVARTSLVETLRRQLFSYDSVCPPVSESTLCPMTDEPLECSHKQRYNARLCRYANQCQANAAGYGAGECVTPGIFGGVGVPCSMEKVPVLCGNEKREFTNQCSANAAGFTAEDCINKESDSETCEKVHKPVICGTQMTEFDNHCIAIAAGFPATTCTLIQTEKIPTMDKSGQRCTMEEYEPVKCGKDQVVFSNKCEAKLAGFSGDSCVPGFAFGCTKNYEPVVCGGENGTKFDNLCLADLFGFSLQECASTN